MNREQRWIPGALAGISATFMGTVVGAGFASGREIYQFFSAYGIYGFVGIGLAFLLMGWAGVKVCQYGCLAKPPSYRDFLQFLLGPRLAGGADLFLSLFFLILIAIMFAGSGAVFEAIHVSRWYGIAITAGLLIGVLWMEFSGLIAINLLVIPLMFCGAVVVSGNVIANHPELIGRGTIISGGPGLPEPHLLVRAIFAALQFSAYNLILAVPVLLSLAKRYPFPRILRWGSWIGCMGLGFMTWLIHGALLSQTASWGDCPLPMVELAKKLGAWGCLGYAVILWGEMLTTLIANTYGLAARLTVVTRFPFRFWVMVLTLAGVILAQFGFTQLIAVIYPVYGVLSFILVVLLFLKVRSPKSNQTKWQRQ